MGILGTRINKKKQHTRFCPSRGNIGNSKKKKRKGRKIGQVAWLSEEIQQLGASKQHPLREVFACMP